MDLIYMRILAIGDVVGSNGCEFLRKKLPLLKRHKAIDFVIANGENSADGNGMTKFSYTHLLMSGVDFVTTGNHVYKRREMYDVLEESLSVIRPANYGDDCPGEGFRIVDIGRLRIAVINMMGVVFMDPLENPFACIDRILEKLDGIKIRLVDFHAEATAEKRAFAFYLDGKVSAVFGTHTHVQTSDDQILPNGTGYITDLGMTGPYHSVLGVTPEKAIARMRTNMPVRFDTANCESYMCGCIFDIEEKTGRTVEVERIEVF